MLLIFFLLTQSWSVYLDSTLAFVGLSKDDITLSSDYAQPDPYRFSIVDSLLDNPLHAIDFTYSAKNRICNSQGSEVLHYLVNQYNLDPQYEKQNFKKTLLKSAGLIREAFLDVPQNLDTIYENLTLFSPELTTSIEEEKRGEKVYDSLVTFLKENSKKVNYDKLFSAGLMLISIAQNYNNWSINMDRKPAPVNGVEGDILYYEKLDHGEIVVGDTGKNVYKKNFMIILDMGGDDEYYCSSQKQDIHILIDKTGNDVYKGNNYTIACGHFGIGILIDESGDDTYQAQCYSIGCGVFGIGILIDKAGNDRYFGDTFTQGAGGFGIGILKDEAGQDTYEGALHAQGFASTYGIGILTDRDGNDQYIIAEKYLDETRYLDHYLSFSQGFSIGFRPELPAGIGMIIDQDGNDCYIGDIYAQGSSYWYGLGALIDVRGNDNYVAYQYTQGEGTHISIGILIDEQGNDNYVAKGVSQGCGHDLAFGLLYDVQGDDSYMAFDLSQGAGNANGIGMLIDASGDDGYSVKRTHNTQGYGDFRREYASIGVLLDLKGHDSYTSGKNQSLWHKEKCGIGIDWE